MRYFLHKSTIIRIFATDYGDNSIFFLIDSSCISTGRNGIQLSGMETENKVVSLPEFWSIAGFWCGS